MLELEDLFFKTNTELSSYSDAFESRARDRLVDYQREVMQAGSSEENQKILVGSRIVVKKKSRRATDLVEVQSFIDRIEIRSLDEEARLQTKELLEKDKGFKNVKHVPEDQLLVVMLPKLNIERKFELSDFIKGKYQNFHKNLVHVKTQTIQQIGAGVKNEYIFPPEAARATKEVDKILAHYGKHGKALMYAKQKEILKRDFSIDDKEDMGYQKLIGQYANLIS